MTGDAKDLVRRGYDAVSYHYRADEGGDDGKRRAWIERLVPRIPSGARVLDLGCGCGVPAARDLVARGLTVTGVDLSDVQIERARRLVPAATFLRADASEVTFPAASFEAVVTFYMLLHLPLAEQPPVLARIASWLVPGGVLIAITGHRAWTGGEENWLGGGAPMWWSHADAATYRRWLTEAGLTVEDEEFVPEDGGGHALFWCRKEGGG